MGSEEIIKQLIEDTGAFNCVECGKCTSVCPVAKYNKEFAPRLIVVKAMDKDAVQNLPKEKDVWTCTTCALCSSMCPYKVDYTEVIRGLRAESTLLGQVPECSQGGLMHSMMRVMAKGSFKQNRLSWLTPDLKVAQKGDIYYFTGCAKHLSVIFQDRKGVDIATVPESAVRLMNAAGIVPAVSNDEVCCGHDLNWTGDEENFTKLVDKNIATIKATGAKQVVFTCPEGLRTFRADYPAVSGADLPFEVAHISTLVAKWIDEGRLKFRETKQKVTYHDSCRLGRHSGIYDPPRKILNAIPGVELLELENTRDKAQCCGVSGWVSCDGSTKKLQLDKMLEAKRTTADVLLTFCPKCQIHLNCAVQDKIPVDKSLVDIPVQDFTVFVASALEKR
jgi:Fe-S oxidoreductase